MPSVDDLDPAVAAALKQLYTSARHEPGVPCSLARLAKQAALPMSSLRRTLTALQDAGLATVVDDDTARPIAALTPQGLAFCADVLPAD